MTQANHSTTHTLQPSLGKRMLIGAGAGLALISLLLFSVKEPNPDWGALWMIRPLIVVSFAGAMAGLCNYYIFYFRSMVGINKAVALFISVMVSIIGLWMGFILGLDGTLWN